jgi:hypothetical protein
MRREPAVVGLGVGFPYRRRVDAEDRASRVAQFAVLFEGGFENVRGRATGDEPAILVYGMSRSAFLLLRRFTDSQAGNR